MSLIERRRNAIVEIPEDNVVFGKGASEGLLEFLIALRRQRRAAIQVDEQQSFCTTGGEFLLAFLKVGESPRIERKHLRRNAVLITNESSMSRSTSVSSISSSINSPIIPCSSSVSSLSTLSSLEPSFSNFRSSTSHASMLSSFSSSTSLSSLSSFTYSPSYESLCLFEFCKSKKFIQEEDFDQTLPSFSNHEYQESNSSYESQDSNRWQSSLR